MRVPGHDYLFQAQDACLTRARITLCLGLLRCHRHSTLEACVAKCLSRVLWENRHADRVVSVNCHGHPGTVDALLRELLPAQGQWSEAAYLWLTDHTTRLMIDS